ncbi:MAG: GNAT family N-acetyltransferase [Caldilinea sp.]|nr:GNAT family N-acetyltransferase [Caldilinea sp.]
MRCKQRCPRWSGGTLFSTCATNRALPSIWSTAFAGARGRRSTCIGYVAASLNDSPREGSIDLLAVDASVRNQGYGRRLLLTAAHWLIQERGMPRVGLTVRDMRADARQLYQRSGFALLYTGVGYSREQTLPRRQL